MSEIDSDLDRAAAAFWLSVANRGGSGRVPALTQAANLLRDAGAEARIPDSAAQPTLNDLEAPPMDLPPCRRLKP
jgi:hypothetical protein